MALEDLTGTKYIGSLVSTNPASGDSRVEGDDHIRGIKNVLNLSFPNITGAVTASQTELNYCDITTLGTGQASKVLTADASANVDASALTFTNLGSVTTCDINGGTVDGVTIGAAVAPTVTNLGSVATADINGGTIDGVTIGATVAPTVTGAALGTAVTAVTQSAGDNSTKIATTAYVDASVKTYTSAAYTTYAAATTLTAAAHSLSGVPDQVWAMAKCIQADLNYAVGDWVSVSDHHNNNNYVGLSWGLQLYATSSTVGGVIGSQAPFGIPDKSSGGTGTPTAGRWEIYIKAVRYT